MKRSGIQRTPFKSSAKKATPSEPKPAKGPRKRKCAICRAEFQPRSMLHKTCSPACAEWYVAKMAAQKRAKQERQERAQDKAKLDSMKTYPQLIKEAQKAFNAVVRMRDKDKPCICCGRSDTKVDVLYGHGWDCGHFRSTGSAAHLRFNFDNAHRQLVYCNRNGAGRAVDYRIGLIERIGLERVEALEADNTPRKWTHDELRAMRAEFQAMLLKMKKEE